LRACLGRSNPKRRSRKLLQARKISKIRCLQTPQAGGSILPRLRARDVEAVMRIWQRMSRLSVSSRLGCGYAAAEISARAGSRSSRRARVSNSHLRDNYCTRDTLFSIHVLIESLRAGGVSQGAVLAINAHRFMTVIGTRYCIVRHRIRSAMARYWKLKSYTENTCPVRRRGTMHRCAG
jgi:hypothetical protein